MAVVITVIVGVGIFLFIIHPFLKRQRIKNEILAKQAELLGKNEREIITENNTSVKL